MENVLMFGRSQHLDAQQRSWIILLSMMHGSSDNGHAG
jgi:hypothetical protein